MKNYFYKLMVLTGLLLWVAESVYFGWNETAESQPERVLDFASMLIVSWGVLGDISSNLTISKVSNISAPNLKKVVVETPNVRVQEDKPHEK